MKLRTGMEKGGMRGREGWGERRDGSREGYRLQGRLECREAWGNLGHVFTNHLATYGFQRATGPSKI